MHLLIPASTRRPFRITRKSAHLELASLGFQNGKQQRAAVDGAMRTMSMAFRDGDYSQVFENAVEVTRGDGTAVSVRLVSANTQLHALNEDAAEFAYGYEPEIATLIDALVPDDGVMVDVGANFGYFSVFLASRPRFSGRIYAFEPSSRGFTDLKTLIEHADLAAAVTIHRLALGDKREKLLLHQSQSDGLSTLMPSMTNKLEPVVATESVDVQRLDEFELSRVDFIKIDVEGAEPQVIRGANETLRRCRPAVVFESWVSCDDSVVFSSLGALEYDFFVPGWKTADGKISTTPAQAVDVSELSMPQFQPDERSKLPERLNILALPREKVQGFA